MGQLLKQEYNAGRGDAWLAGLVATFDQVETLRNARCDDATLDRVRARLARPVTFRTSSAGSLATALLHSNRRKISLSA